MVHWTSSLSFITLAIQPVICVFCNCLDSQSYHTFSSNHSCVVVYQTDVFTLSSILNIMYLACRPAVNSMKSRLSLTCLVGGRQLMTHNLAVENNKIASNLGNLRVARIWSTFSGQPGRVWPILCDLYSLLLQDRIVTFQMLCN